MATKPSLAAHCSPFERRVAVPYFTIRRRVEGLFMIYSRRFGISLFALLLSQCLSRPSLLAQSTSASDKRPLNYANGLVGTAPLDDQHLIGNAPPPGEQIYSGFTSPGAELPHG